VTRRRWMIVGSVATVVLALTAGLVWMRSRDRVVSHCDSLEYASPGDETAQVENYRAADVPEPAGAVGTVVEIGPWDPNADWAFRQERSVYGREQELYRTIEEGVFHAHLALDVSRTRLSPTERIRERSVIIGGDLWEERASSGSRRQCPLLPGRQPRNVLVVHIGVHRPPLVGTVANTPLDAVAELLPGSRLPVGPGTATTVDGEPGTAYVWVPKEEPWLRIEFTLDGRRQLRAARVSDAERGVEYLTMRARPAPDRPIVDPTDQPIVALP
jgi:hypothetical protein